MVSLPGALRRPSFKPKWRKPTSAKMIRHWPPAGAKKDHIVRNGNFAEIAGKEDINNVWDLIIFNFQTEVPREVNWYLHHAVGCWQSTDRMNFCFDGAYTADGKQGRIYIPPSDWRPPSHFKRGSGYGGQVDHLADTSVRILERLAVRMPGIYHGGTQLPARAYRTVADLIKRRAINVDINTELGHDEAEYDDDNNMLYLGSPVLLSRTLSYGILANEATHAFNHYSSNATDSYKEEVASSLADSIAVACIDENTSLALMRDKEKPLRELLYFPGWVWLNHLSRRMNVTLEDFNRTYEHPITGEQLNAKTEFLRYHDLAGYGGKKIAVNIYEWDPHA